MKLEFFDRQEKSNPPNGTLIDGAEFLDFLEQAKRRQPFFCEIVGKSGKKILLGIGEAVGCVQFSSNDGSPPYWVATNPQANFEHFADFLIDNEATSIPKRYCLPMESVEHIAMRFFENELRDPSVPWEEV